MLNRCPLLSVAVAAVICSLNARSASASKSPSVIHFEMDEHGGVIVPVTIDAHGPYRFLLDTGSSGSSVSETLVSQIDAPVVAKADVTSVGGPTTRRVVGLQNVALGKVTSREILAVTVAPGDLVLAGVSVIGVLGQDFLGPHNYTLDYRHHTLTWDSDDAKPTNDAGTTLKLVPRKGQLLVELPQADSTTLRMVPDSGADAIIVFKQPDTRLAFTETGDARQVAGMTGSRNATSAVVQQLKVGSITLRNQAAVTVVLPGDDEYASDGLLPLHHFASVSFRTSGYILFRR